MRRCTPPKPRDETIQSVNAEEFCHLSSHHILFEAPNDVSVCLNPNPAK